MNSTSIKPKRKNKIIPTVIIVVVIIAGAIVFNVFSNKSSEDTKYTLGTVEKGMLINTLSSTGQVYVSSQYDIKSKVTSTVIDVLKKKGDKVKKGDIILTIDSADLTKQLRSAQNNLANAKNNYEKAVAPMDALSSAQAESSLQNAKDSLEKLKLSQINALSSANDSKNNAETSLNTSYDSALNTIDSAFSGFANIINDSRKILYLTDTLLPQDVNSSETNNNLIDINSFWNVEMPKYWSDVLSSTSFDSEIDRKTLEDLIKKATVYYKNSKVIYDKNVINYRNLSKTSSNDDIKLFLDNAIETSQSVSDSIRSLSNVYNYYIDYTNQRHRTIYSSINTYNNTLKTDSTSSNGYLTSLTNSKTSIYSAESNLKNAITSLNTLENNQPMDLVAAQNSLKIQQESYNKSKKGPDALEIKTYKLSIDSATASLIDVQEQIDNYIIKAPFDGIVASISVSAGSEVSTSTALATIVTNKSIAQLTFNEVDIAKIKEGQKVTLAFDAISDLTLTGEVIDVDSLGTVSQGIVSYVVKIAFDTSDDRIKPGMSVTANIIINSKSDVLLVDNAAVKVSGGSNYVQVFENNKSGSTVITSSTPPTKKTVEIGLSNDTYTEIVSGLSEGDEIVIKTTLPSVTSSKTTGSSLFQMSGSSNRTGTTSTRTTTPSSSMPPSGF